MQNVAEHPGDFWRNCLFSVHFPAMVPHPPFFHPHVYGFRLFLPIFCLKWYPILVINTRTVILGGILPIFCSFSADFLPMVPHLPFFRLCSAQVSCYFLPNLPLMFRLSCLAGSKQIHFIYLCIYVRVARCL